MGRSLRLALVRRVLVGVLLALFLAPAIGSAGTVTITFTAADVKAAMAAQGASLSDDAYQWGLWAVRAMPIVTGGTYAVTFGSTTQPGWGTDAPSTYAWPVPYGTNSAWFWDDSGAGPSGGTPNPLYMIMDQPADTFTSYFGNPVTEVSDSAQFSFVVELSSDATLVGWQFVVDGSKYTLGTQSDQGEWVADFFGGYDLSGNPDYGVSGPGGDLPGNMGAGYAVPDSGATLTLLGCALVGLGALRRKFRG